MFLSYFKLNEKHLVAVKLQDMNGDPRGLITTGTATVTLSDINDNPPTFMKTSVSILTE